jgi:hypothetical protein
MKKYFFKVGLIALMHFGCTISFANDIVWCPVGPYGPVKEACRPEKGNCEIQDSNKYGCYPIAMSTLK